MSKCIIIPIILAALLVGFTACGTTTTTIEVVGVVGPLPPYNPGGPSVEITLKNNAAEPVISLKATLELQQSYEFDFGVSESSPLAPGAIASKTQTLLNGGISSDISYPLAISATLQSGSVISYTVQVKISVLLPAI
jgi:hypothetical protein